MIAIPVVLWFLIGITISLISYNYYYKKDDLKLIDLVILLFIALVGPFGIITLSVLFGDKVIIKKKNNIDI